MARPDDPAEVRERFDATLELVEIIARRVARSIGPAANLDELVSFGQEGLLDAARRYDASRGVPFRSYANYRVRGAIIDGVRSLARLPRRTHQRLNGLDAAGRFSEGALEDSCAPRPPGSAAAEAERALADHLAGMATAMTLGIIAPVAHGDEGELVSQSTDEDPEERVARAELLAVVGDAIAELPPQEAELVRRHYLGGERFDVVAAELGLSKSWGSRLHTRALGRLAKRLRGVAG
ncbi:MAG: sigma-70 family RNA polymerase sigma factor [Sorangiineae bacterium]|nr:sigma-70 family RNA polymerase sigma factor [Polyangiaceae bacterium]MEB2322190.1 sigma-70 family RNA polymerase sigma factor [Sorangiineae bacterium]